MAVTINADNGAVSGSAGLKQAADSTGILALQTNGTTAISVDASQVVTLTNALAVASGGTGTTSTTFVNLTTNVTGTLPVANGGTGVTSSTGSGSVVLGTSPSISGAVLSSMASSVITSSTAVASTSGTSINFTSIPSWVKRIIVMFNAVSLSGNSTFRIQLGTGATPTYTTSGYVTFGITFGAASLGAATDTSGFPIGQNQTAAGVTTYGGNCMITNVTGNTWSYMAMCGGSSTTNGGLLGGGSVPLGAVLTAVRVTTINGTDTFDAGSINILYE
jgi:hypothetical protein